MTGIDLTTWARGPMDELSVEGRIDQVARAQAVAVVAHEGQIDKLGVAYIGHPAAVAARFDPKEQTLEHCAAWLHDVIEDTSVDANLLARAGIHDDVIEVVKLLTRGPDDGDDYYRRIAAHPAARAVKLSDIRHNTDPDRTHLLDAESRERLAAKYRHALHLLGN
ncbi:hypothetical protein Cch01nite_16990 [Cellulomonas chitinilytica]|uniref:Phosphohydrolase n=1 Tax=Cellulomonas chitinilytica TaxID=398759 RepID=A0A919TYU3_9CELL|nr:phosphohydrolase [Cellulomonas chitinilytica]GIG20975.1 hypothetical protein Cch01nite_16990 [Cellulomonas chitinilytica]